jgi:predicted enzyme related to lactoylglutathione lyase
MKILGMTLAVYDMPAMLNFYERVFGMQFEASKMQGFTLYRSELDNLKVLFCPAELAQVEAAKVTAHGGQLMQEPQQLGALKRVGVMDPDGNSLVLESLN